MLFSFAFYCVCLFICMYVCVFLSCSKVSNNVAPPPLLSPQKKKKKKGKKWEERKRVSVILCTLKHFATNVSHLVWCLVCYSRKTHNIFSKFNRHNCWLVLVLKVVLLVKLDLLKCYWTYTRRACTESLSKTVNK